MSEVSPETTEAVIEPTRKISVEFSRTVSDGNYGSIGAKVWVQGEVPADASVGEVNVAAADILTAAVATVLDQLGIEYEPDADMLLREKFVPKAAPAAVAQATAERVLGATEGHSTGGIKVMNPKDSPGPLDQWLIDAAIEAGVTAVWDNRSKATGDQPKYREAIARGAEGSGHGKDGAPKAFFAPR